MSAWTHTVTGGPWPERIGRRCRIVPQPTGPDLYPWFARGATQEIVLIEDDPFGHHFAVRGVEWTCALDRRHITPIEAA